MFSTDPQDNPTNSASAASSEAITNQINKFKEILLSVNRSDRQRTEHHVRKLYADVGLPAPRYFAWFGSPAAGAIAVSMLQGGERAADSAYLEVVLTSKDRVSLSARKQSEANGASSWWRNAYEKLTHGPVNQRHNKVAESVLFAVSRYALGSAWEATGWLESEEMNGPSGPAGWISDVAMSQMPRRYLATYSSDYPPSRELWGSGSGIKDFDHGCYDAPKLQFYDFCRARGMDLPFIDHLVEIAKNCAWWWPRHDLCIMTEKPQIIGIDRAGNLHHEDGPCIKFRDGWMAYALHGDWLPPRVVAFSKSPNLFQIEAEMNAEFRRRMLEMYGIEKFMKDSKTIRVQQDECGTLLRKDLPGDEPIMMVCVTNSTPEEDGSYKQYFLRVPPTVRSAREGVAWTFGLSPLTYRPVKQT